MTVAILGVGNVGGALARALRSHGVDVILCQDPRRGGTLPAWANTGNFRSATPESACAQADALLLCIPFDATTSALKPLATSLRGKVVVDCTNPVGPGMTHALKSVRSGSEHIQDLLPESHVVKCFSVYGYENLEQGTHEGARPAMFYCGDDVASKQLVCEMVAKLGWDPVDAGPLTQALHLEHMTLLWIAMVRVGGAPIQTLWARA